MKTDIASLTEILDRMMPLHARLTPRGVIAHVGPTLLRLREPGTISGHHFYDVFDVKRPRATTDIAALALVSHNYLRLQFRNAPTTNLRGQLIALPEDQGYLLNLSFGIGVVEAVRKYGLTASDFPPTDLTIEMLYLQEAKSAVFEESRRLNRRLDAARAKAETRAMTDPLTGLPNRRAVDAELVRTVQAGRPFALLQMDLDYFKDVNDAKGHAAGDAVLCEVGKRFSAEVRSNDMVARLGGDEFLLLLAGDIEKTDLMGAATRIRKSIEVPIEFEGAELRISVSVGAARSSDFKEPKVETILTAADEMLYVSKRSGRAQTTIFDADLPTDQTNDATDREAG